jgi:hypothetical protein
MTSPMAIPGCTELEMIVEPLQTGTYRKINMKHIVLKAAWALMLLAAALTGSAYAGAATLDSGDKPVSKKAKKKTAAGGQVKFLPGSAETTAERNRRLKRECKGRVNAGACSGYTG